MRRRSSRARRAAEMYLDNGGDDRRGDIAMRVCAERYGVAVGTVYTAVKMLRKERRQAVARPEGECAP